MSGDIRRLILPLGLAALAAGCGASATGADHATSQLESLVRARLDLHPGFHVRSVRCPKVRVAKGNVVVRVS